MADILMYGDSKIMDNKVTRVIKNIIKKNNFLVNDCFYGKINIIGNEKCILQEQIKMGGVYGISIKIDNSSNKQEILSKINKLSNSTSITINQWKEIDNGYYPLYWGIDSYLGSRIHAHIKQSNTTRAIHLSNSRYSFLEEYEVVYGAVLCENKEKIEKKLKEEYPDVLKTF